MSNPTKEEVKQLLAKMERAFCLAIMQEGGTDFIARVLENYQKFLASDPYGPPQTREDAPGAAEAQTATDPSADLVSQHLAAFVEDGRELQLEPLPPPFDKLARDVSVSAVVCPNCEGEAVMLRDSLKVRTKCDNCGYRD